MNREETSGIIGTLKAIYPNHPIPDPSTLISAWQIGLGDLPVEAVQRAVAVYIQFGGDTSYRGFPDPSTLRRIVASAVLGLPDKAEAWRMALDRMRSTYPGRPASDWGVPDALRRSVETIGGLYALRMSENLGADQRRFNEVYGEFHERAIRQANLPALCAMTPEERAMIDGSARGEPVYPDDGEERWMIANGTEPPPRMRKRAVWQE